MKKAGAIRSFLTSCAGWLPPRTRLVWLEPSDKINIRIKQSNIRIAIFSNSLYNKFV